MKNLEPTSERLRTTDEFPNSNLKKRILIPDVCNVFSVPFPTSVLRQFNPLKFAHILIGFQWELLQEAAYILIVGCNFFGDGTIVLIIKK